MRVRCFTSPVAATTININDWIGHVAPGSRCSAFYTLYCTIGANATSVLSLILLFARCIYLRKWQSSPPQWALRISGFHHCSGMYPPINPYPVSIEKRGKKTKNGSDGLFSV